MKYEYVDNWGRKISFWGGKSNGPYRLSVSMNGVQQEFWRFEEIIHDLVTRIKELEALTKADAVEIAKFKSGYAGPADEPDPRAIPNEKFK